MPSDMLDDNLEGAQAMTRRAEPAIRNRWMLGAGLLVAVAVSGCTPGAGSREMRQPSPEQTTLIPTTIAPPQVQESSETG